MADTKKNTSYFDRLNKLFTRSLRLYVKGKDEIYNLDINKRNIIYDLFTLK